LSPFGVLVPAVAVTVVIVAVVLVLVAPATVTALAAFVVALAVITITFLAVDVGLIFDCCVCRRLVSSSPPSPRGSGSTSRYLWLCYVQKLAHPHPILHIDA
jgi:hypothetical protein